MMNEFDQALSDLLLSVKDRYPATLYSSIEYALMTGGKRIRPRLCFFSAQFCDIPTKKVLPLALAIECIHSYSLIHDDMPCMDNDTMRRGKPTVHVAFGEAMALLCGDALLNLAYEILFSAAKDDPDLLPSCSLIASCAGGEGMIGGQVMEFDGTELIEDTLFVLDDKKTGKMIQASVLSAALLSGDGKKLSILSSYAKYAGLAFQLSDDLLDKDKSERASFVTVCGEEKTISLLHSLCEKASKLLSNYGKQGKNLLELFNNLAFRTR